MCFRRNSDRRGSALDNSFAQSRSIFVVGGRGFARCWRVFEITGKTCRLWGLVVPRVTTLRCDGSSSFGMLHSRGFDCRGNGSVIQAEANIDVNRSTTVGRWDLKVERLFATGMTILMVSQMSLRWKHTVSYRLIGLCP